MRALSNPEVRLKADTGRKSHSADECGDHFIDACFFFDYLPRLKALSAYPVLLPDVRLNCIREL